VVQNLERDRNLPLSTIYPWPKGFSTANPETGQQVDRYYIGLEVDTARLHGTQLDFSWSLTNFKEKVKSDMAFKARNMTWHGCGHAW